MKKLLFLISMSVMAYSCTTPIPDLEINSSTSISFSKEGGSSIISIKAYSDWTAKCDASWVTLSPASGTASSDGVPMSIKVIVKENSEYDDRSATITITSNEKVFTLSVTQKMKTAVIVSDAEQTVTYEATVLTFKGQANVSKTVEVSSDSKDWIVYSPTKAMESFDVILNIAENNNDEDREGKVYVKSSEPGIADTITIFQTAKPSILFCDAPGVYSGREMLAGYTDYISQTGFVSRASGSNNFQIANISTRKYCLFTNLKPSSGTAPESPYTVNIQQNMVNTLDWEFTLNLTIYKYEDGTIWGLDEIHNIGAILKIE